jgi:hypothetical protein
VKSRQFLEDFRRDWKYHHPISPEQIEAAGVTDTVKEAERNGECMPTTDLPDCRLRSKTCACTNLAILHLTSSLLRDTLLREA